MRVEVFQEQDDGNYVNLAGADLKDTAFRGHSEPFVPEVGNMLSAQLLNTGAFASWPFSRHFTHLLLVTGSY